VHLTSKGEKSFACDDLLAKGGTKGKKKRSGCSRRDRQGLRKKFLRGTAGKGLPD